MSNNRVVFLDYLRVIAIFMVMLVHVCECYYFGPDGGFLIESKGDAAGWAIVAGLFYARIPNYGATYPVSAPYAAAVDLEMSWEFCSLGVALTVIAYFLLIRKLTGAGAFYRFVVLPLSGASYGVYLIHIFVLTAVIGWFKPALTTPLAIGAAAVCIFTLSAAVSIAGRKLPVVGKWIFG